MRLTIVRGYSKIGASSVGRSRWPSFRKWLKRGSERLRSGRVRFKTDAIARQVIHALNNDCVVLIASIDLVFQSAKHRAVFFLLIAVQLKRFKTVCELLN